MKRVGKFAITLAAAGYMPLEAKAVSNVFPGAQSDEKMGSLFQILRGEHKYTLAKHGSHSSHGSHRSSSGATRPRTTTPAPNYNAPAPRSNSNSPNSVMPRAPEAPKVLPGNSATFANIVKQVQTALYAYGYYTGGIDGLVGSGTKTAISKFQKDWGLNVTGTITPEVLDALNIIAK